MALRRRSPSRSTNKPRPASRSSSTSGRRHAMPSADSQRGRLDGVAPGHTRTGGVGPTLTAERSGSSGARLVTREALVPLLDELTVIQADAIRATAAAHDRDPDELAFELVHLLAADRTSEAIDASCAIPALTTDHDDTVRILLPPSGTAGDRKSTRL